MSLQSRLSSLITALGADIKALQTRRTSYNASSSDQTGFSSDTYLAGSSVAIPTGKIKVGTIYKCRFNVVKTGAGTAAPVINVRVGTAGSTADTSRVSLTLTAQTGVIDEGEVDVDIVFRAAGASAVAQAFARLRHRLVSTGLATTSNTFVSGTSGSFDITGAGLIIGLSVNAGASAAWTISLVSAELRNLTP